MKEKEEVVNINFLKKVWYSITNFEQYPVMATEGLLRAIKYLTILTAIVTVFTMISSLLQMNKVIDNLAQYIEQNIPDFSITEGKVTMDLEQPIIIEKVKYTGIDKVVINPLAETDEQREQSEEAETVSGITVFFFSDKIVLISKIAKLTNIDMNSIKLEDNNTFHLLKMEGTDIFSNTYKLTCNITNTNINIISLGKNVTYIRNLIYLNNEVALIIEEADSRIISEKLYSVNSSDKTILEEVKDNNSLKFIKK